MFILLINKSYEDMDYNIIKDLLDKGYKIKKVNWNDEFLTKINDSVFLAVKRKKSKFLPSLEELKCNDWTIKYD